MAPRGAVLFGYFFGPRRPEVSSLSEMRGYRPEDALLVELFGDPALRQGEWPVLGRLDSWDRKMWPMPAFGRVVQSIPSDHAAAAWRVQYPDDNPNGVPRETRITVEEAKHLPQDGLSGAKAAEIELTRLLGSKDDVTRLTASLPTYPKPDQPTIDYFLYFPTQAAAMRAARRLESEGYIVEVRDSHDMNAGWLTLAKHTLPADEEELDAVEAHMEELAAGEEGNYDGYERDVPSSAME